MRTGGMRGFERERPVTPRVEEQTTEEATADVEARLAGGVVPGVAGPAEGAVGPTASEIAYADPEQVGEAIAAMPGQRHARALEGIQRTRGGDFAAQAARAVPRAAERQGKDRTDEFNTAMADIQSGNTALPPDAANYVYMLVPGLMCNIYPYLGATYMEENEAQLKGRGLDVRVLRKMNSVASVKANAGYIKNQVEEVFKTTGKKVVLVGHSKGGVDASAALSLHAEIRPFVRAVVTIQAPLGGAVAGSLAPLGPGFWDLSHLARREFVKKHPYVADQVATLNVATRDRPGSSGDGLVMHGDQKSKGADSVNLEGWDHGSTALGVPAHEDDRGPMTEALVALALRQASEMDEERAGEGDGGN
jgi:triacylglycerol lipase